MQEKPYLPHKTDDLAEGGRTCDDGGEGAGAGAQGEGTARDFSSLVQLHPLFPFVSVVRCFAPSPHHPIEEQDAFKGSVSKPTFNSRSLRFMPLPLPSLRHSPVKTIFCLSFLGSGF